MLSWILDTRALSVTLSPREQDKRTRLSRDMVGRQVSELTVSLLHVLFALRAAGEIVAAVSTPAVVRGFPFV